MTSHCFAFYVLVTNKIICTYITFLFTLHLLVLWLYNSMISLWVSFQLFVGFDIWLLIRVCIADSYQNCFPPSPGIGNCIRILIKYGSKCVSMLSCLCNDLRKNCHMFAQRGKFSNNIQNMQCGKQTSKMADRK